MSNNNVTEFNSKSSTLNSSVDMDRKFPDDPLELVTSKFKPKEILFYGNGFVVASGEYENRPKTIACRWHSPGKIGYPNGFGKPQWMKLGNLTMRNVEKVFKDTGSLQQLKLSFMKADSNIMCGTWLRFRNDWYIVKYLDGTMMSNVAMCQQEDGSLIVPVSLCDVEEIISEESGFFKWHRSLSSIDGYVRNRLVWLSREGVLSTTRLCPNGSTSLVDQSLYQITFGGKLKNINNETLCTGRSLEGHYLLGSIDNVIANRRNIANEEQLLELYYSKLPIVKAHVNQWDLSEDQVERKSFDPDVDNLFSQTSELVNYYQVK